MTAGVPAVTLGIMHLLLIDNGTRQLDELLRLCQSHQVTTISPEQLAGVDGGGYDGIVLSGSYQHNPVYEEPYFMAEISLLQTTTKPVLGFCQGFELICYAYGCQLHELAERQLGAAKVTPTEDGAKIFQGTDPVIVTEAHRWDIEVVPRDLVVLARSETGIEAVRHRNKQIYGLQFYPEDFKYSSDGKMVFDNILDALTKSR